MILADLGQPELARAEYEAARELLQQLAADFADESRYRVDLGGTYCNHGNLIRNKEGRPADSLHWYDLAVRTLTPVSKTTGARTARLYLRNSHLSRAQAYDHLRKHTEAVNDWDKTVELSPESEQPVHRASRAFSRARAGQTDEAVAEVAELTTASNWSAWQWYHFASVYAVAAARIAEKNQVYADRAMDLLGRAVKAGFDIHAHMRMDTNLDALRGRSDFKRLLADLEARADRPESPEPKRK